MEIAKLILDFLKVLAWPVLVASLALLFRRELRAILTRVSKAKLPGGLDIDFGYETEQLAPKEAREKVLSEQAEAASGAASLPPQEAKIPPGEVPVDSSVDTQHAYVIEQLALAKVEQNLNKPIRKFIRLKKGGKFIELDGLMLDKDSPIDDIVEVKWLRDPRKVRGLIDLAPRLEAVLREYEDITGKKARLILVLVVPQSVKEVRDYLLPLKEAFADLECRIVVLDYASIGFTSP